MNFIGLSTWQCANAGTANAQALPYLLQFWIHFLSLEFNSSMYHDFERLAAEEFERGHAYGAECLFLFYQQALTKRFQPRVYQDFERLALKVMPAASLDMLSLISTVMSNAAS